MRRTIPLLAAALLLCASLPARARLRVVATVPDLAALARAVGGERVEVIALTLPTQDPHFADAKPNLVLQLNRADLVLVIGLQLEVGWLPVLLTGARNPKIQRGSSGYLDCSTVVKLLEVPRERVDRSMGDIHPGGNPHYLAAPANAARVVRALVTRLGQLAPDGQAVFRRNGDRLVAELRRAGKRWSALMRPFRDQPVVTYHRSWTYFTEAMGLKVVAYLEPKPGIPPNAGHVLRVIQAIRARKVSVILQEEYYPDRTAQLIAKKTGARLVVLKGGADLRRGQTYLQRMEAMVRAVSGALGQGG